MLEHAEFPEGIFSAWRTSICVFRLVLRTYFLDLQNFVERGDIFYAFLEVSDQSVKKTRVVLDDKLMHVVH